MLDRDIIGRYEYERRIQSACCNSKWTCLLHGPCFCQLGLGLNTFRLVTAAHLVIEAQIRTLSVPILRFCSYVAYFKIKAKHPVA